MADIGLTYHDDLAHVVSAPLGVEARLAKTTGPMKEFAVALLKAARAEWNDEAWALFDLYADHRILTVKKWFLSFTFRVKHCGALLTLLVGPRPAKEG